VGALQRLRWQVRRSEGELAYTTLAASLAYQFGLESGVTKSRDFRFAVIDEAFGRGSDASTRYALELFAKLGLQLLIVTPLQKVQVIEPYVNPPHEPRLDDAGRHRSPDPAPLGRRHPAARLRGARPLRTPLSAGLPALRPAGAWELPNG
jgi:hypothetical protein